MRSKRNNTLISYLVPFSDVFFYPKVNSSYKLHLNRTHLLLLEEQNLQIFLRFFL